MIERGMENERYVTWAREEFGCAQLGDQRRTNRLVAVGAGAAANPGGVMTQVFPESGEREGAFRFVQNEGVAAEAIGRACHAATAKRCVGETIVLVPVDESDVSLPYAKKALDLGYVGPRRCKMPGMCVMTAMGVTLDGTPLGALGQAYWTRTKKARRVKKDRRPVTEKETQKWLDAMGEARDVLSRESPGTIPWFQNDRGADSWPVLLEMRQFGLVTVRAVHDRRLVGEVDGQRDSLFSHLDREPVLGFYDLAVPAGPNRTARTARIEVRACTVTLDLLDPCTRKHMALETCAVQAREVGTTPVGEAVIEWRLLTNFPVRGFDDARLVVFAYAMRWRIEEFHRTWKSGACKVEEIQLEQADHIERWLRILAAVAMRIVRLTYLARTQPDVSPTLELSPAEIRATILLRQPKGIRPDAKPTMGQVVRWIADLGGYTGKSSGGPPGALVLTRGLRRVEPVALLIERGTITFLDGEGEK